MNNFVEDRGGAIYLTYQIGMISSNQFINNYARAGGVIYYEEDRFISLI